MPSHRLPSSYLPGLLLALISLPHSAPAATPPPAKPAKPAKAQPALAANYGKLPLSFEANQGQTDPSVKFLSHGSGYSLFLTEDGALLALSKPGKSSDQSAKQDLVRMTLFGSKKADAAGAELPGAVNYFLGNDPSQMAQQHPHLRQSPLRQRLPRRRPGLLRQPA
jgi:hypothetical protein